MNRIARWVSRLTVMLLAATVVAGCSAGGSTGYGGASPDDEVGGTTGELGEAEADDLAIGGDTGCISGRLWQLDLDDLASQIAAQLTAQGFEVLDYEAGGGSTIEFDEAGAVSISAEQVYRVNVVTDADARIGLVQVHLGFPSGEWGWKGNTNVMEFANWDSADYSVSSYIDVNGINLDSEIPIPGDTMSGTDMTVECAGSKMTTIVEGSPFIQRWTTED